jgi:hypothetical protein
VSHTIMSVVSDTVRVTKGKLMEKKCFLCMDADGGNAVPAVEYSPYGYDVCLSHYRSDFSEFVSDYS